MTGLEGPFPDIEMALVSGLPGLLHAPNGGTVTAGTVFLPKDEPSGSNAFVRVTLVSDPDDGITRRASVDIDIFSTSRTVGYAVGEQVRGVLLSVRRIGGVTLDTTLTVSGPKLVPWDNSNIRRVLGTYRISTRR